MGQGLSGSFNESIDSWENRCLRPLTDGNGSNPHSDSSSPPQSDVRELLSGEGKLVNDCFLYLSDTGYTLWANWLISSPDRRLEAARWLASQITAVAMLDAPGCDRGPDVVTW
jgi:hypothetical protein